MTKSKFPGLALLALAAATAGDASAATPPVFSPPLLTLENVQVVNAFRGLDGKVQPAGSYDLGMRQEARGIVIDLIKRGRKVVELPGKFVPGAGNPPDPDRKISLTNPPEPDRKAGMSNPPEPDRNALHFDVSSKVSFGRDGAGKISPSSKTHPGGANLGFIEFQLPGAQPPSP